LVVVDFQLGSCNEHYPGTSWRSTLEELQHYSQRYLAGVLQIDFDRSPAEELRYRLGRSPKGELQLSLERSPAVKLQH
jgi:hypothetical protein